MLMIKAGIDDHSFSKLLYPTAVVTSPVCQAMLACIYAVQACQALLAHARTSPRRTYTNNLYVILCVSVT